MLRISRSSAVGSALRSGRRGRAFESPLLDRNDSHVAVVFGSEGLSRPRSYLTSFERLLPIGNFRVASSRQKRQPCGCRFWFRGTFTPAFLSHFVRTIIADWQFSSRLVLSRIARTIITRQKRQPYGCRFWLSAASPRGHLLLPIIR